MDSVFDKTIEITHGLGDCIVAAAAVQKLSKLNNNKKIKFKTNNKLNFLFDGHPNIELSNETDTCKLLWVSQIRSKINLNPLHTMQRFSYQLGIFLDPTEVFDPYVNGNLFKYENKNNRVVCINDLSAEFTRRFLPKNIVNLILQYCKIKNYEVIFIGDSAFEKNNSSILDNSKKLKNCSLFIGPVSFYYHLASAIGTPSLLFTSYMPEHKFSHFYNTTCIGSNRSCTYLCEEDEHNLRNINSCWSSCKAVDYNADKIIFELNRLLP